MPVHRDTFNQARRRAISGVTNRVFPEIAWNFLKGG